MKKIAFALVLVAFCSVASAAEATGTTRENSADTIKASIKFEGETVANKGLVGEVARYIFEHRQDSSCQTLEGVKAAPLPLVGAPGFPRRYRPNFVKDDAYEMWEVTMCGAKSSYLVRFAFETEENVLYWVNPSVGRAP